jgi:CheY-like chemotaxis protein
MTNKGDIMVIDDDPDFCEIARIVLEAHSYSVRCACTGPEGLAQMREKKPDLVFLDVVMVMPDEGVYVSQEMAHDPDLKDISVVMVTSIMGTDYAGHFPTDQPLHVRLFLDKPLAPEELVEVSDSLLAGGRANS